MPEIISVTEAGRNFSDVINRVYYQGYSYLLTRGGTVIAQLNAVSAPLTGHELLCRWPDRPRLDPKDAVDWEEELRAANTAVKAPAETTWNS